VRGPAQVTRARATGARLLGGVTGAALVLVAIGGYQLTRHSGAPPARPRAVAPPPLLPKAAFEHRSGIRIVRVSVSGAGGLVDLRYQVLDPDAAASVHDAATPPQLVDEGTGVLVNSLFMGHSHQGRLNRAQTYYLVFDNPGSLVHRGTRVTVQLGAARVAHVPVR